MRSHRLLVRPDRLHEGRRLLNSTSVILHIYSCAFNIIMPELYLKQTYACLFDAGCHLAFHSDESVTTKDVKSVFKFLLFIKMRLLTFYFFNVYYSLVADFFNPTKPAKLLYETTFK